MSISLVLVTPSSLLAYLFYQLCLQFLSSSSSVISPSPRKTILLSPFFLAFHCTLPIPHSLISSDPRMSDCLNLWVQNFCLNLWVQNFGKEGTLSCVLEERVVMYGRKDNGNSILNKIGQLVIFEKLER